MTVFHHSCGFVVFCEEKEERLFLLLQYPEGHFDFPKGHREDADIDELATAVREFTEETGIQSISPVSGFMTTMEYSYRRDNEQHQKVVDYFLGEVNCKDVEISHEHKGFVWLPYVEALEKVTFDNAKDILVAAESFLRTLK